MITQGMKWLRALLVGMVGKIIFQPLVDDGKIQWPHLQGLLNQWLMEQGHSPFWILSRQECLEHWGEINNHSRFKGNRPIDYAAKDTAIMSLVRDFIKPEISTEQSVLELGCNSGSNLEYLREAGFTRLAGIELNPEAVKVLAEFFPELSHMADIKCGSIEDILPLLPNNSFDLVFTMATLEHVHPSINFIFAHIARVSSQYILTVEAETASCSYLFPRNYRRVFNKLGYHQVKSVTITKESSAPNYAGYTLRLLRK